MIKTLQDLHLFSKTQAADERLIGDEILIPSPGLSAEEVARVRAELPGLPDSYLSVVKELDLESDQIEFQLSPCSHGKRRGDMVRCLLGRNSEENYFFPLLTENKLYEVGDYEGDPVCVSGRDAAHPGEVIRVDHEVQTLHRMANNFEQLVIGLGRLWEHYGDSGPRGQEGVDVFLTSIKQDFGLDDEQLQEWTWVSEMMLDDSWDE
jgi:hypothetical protein